MRCNKLGMFAAFMVITMATAALAQNTRPQRSARKPGAETQPAQVEVQNDEKVRDLVAFLQLLLNTLGSNTTSARDKEVVINESYAKIFRDDKVQVEDDLDENRSVITNKDVVAYLKDVDFFFENVSFEFTIDGIEQGVNAKGQVFYKVSLRRNLKGTTAAGKQVENTIPRYIEVNYDPDAEDLKIASIYTNEFDEREALTNWWNSLSFEWQTIFKRKLTLIDSVELDDIKDMTAIHELDLSGNEFIQSLEPLSRLISLQLLNLSHTQVSDLTPIRNLTELVELNLEGTKVFDLTPLRYSNKLQRLNISHTDIRSIAVLEKLTALQNLEMQFSHVIDFEPLKALTDLQNLDLKGSQLSALQPLADLVNLMGLNISRTPVQELSSIANLTLLTSLNIDSTLVRDIQSLKDLKDLEVLYANYTYITDLAPLRDLPNLKRIYCDQTPVKKDAANAFMAARPAVLVIYDSKDLQAWWSTLSTGWQRLLSERAGTRFSPGKEELARVTNLDSISLANNRGISSLEPLRRLQKLKVVLANNTGIDDLSPLKDHRDIRVLDISDTEVVDLSPVSRFSRLESFKGDRSKIEKLDPLFNLKHLKEVYVDRTTVHDITAQEFLQHKPSCLIVYKTIHLDRWWSNLSEGWKEVFYIQMGKDTATTREKLHRLVQLKKLAFADARVRDLSPLEEFVRLEELHFSGTGVAEIPDMGALRSLRSLHAANSPLQTIGGIALLRDLTDLDISNTPVDDLRGMEEMENLRSFNCAGTQIKKLDPLRSLHNLESLDCSNTRVKKLDPVTYLSLQTLKCYNTRINARRIEQFRENNPECRIVYYR